MNTKEEPVESKFDAIKWLVVFLLISGGIYANSVYGQDVKFILKVVGWLALTGVVAFVAFNTAKGQAFWTLFRESQMEVRKVVWPSKEETNQTTLLVSGVVVVTAIVLWVLDWGIGQLAKLIIA
jgi:preprotein translocase subunit SecE